MEERCRREEEKIVFTGFTTAEIEKMEKSLEESRENSLDVNVVRKLTKNFNRSKGRAGLPRLKTAEVRSWLRNRLQDRSIKDTSFDDLRDLTVVPVDFPEDNTNASSQLSKGEKDQDLSKLEFEARSMKDGAWYDVDTFLSHRFLTSGEAEVRVRFVGFGSEEDEWVNVKTAVRERSVHLEHSECEQLKVGDLVVCFQENTDLARYYDAHVVEIQKKLHDIRGCRCLFLIQYDHDKTKETVRLRRLCVRPVY